MTKTTPSSVTSDQSLDKKHNLHSESEKVPVEIPRNGRNDIAS